MLSPLWSYSPVTVSLTLLAMCCVMHLPVSVTLCPILMSKNLQPGFRIAPYRLFRLIFLTSCLLSQYSLSISLSPHSRIFLCISCLSSYQRFSNPGIMASYSYVNRVPFALNIHLLLPSKTNSYSCAALILTLVWSSQSTMISVPFSLFMTAWYSQLPNWLSHAAANDFFACMALLISADVITGLICPMMVSGPMFNARITLGYSELMSTDPIQSCIPFCGVATWAPAAG